MSGARRWFGFAFLELLAAAGFAIGQPLLAVFGRSPDEFIFRQSRPWQIVAFAVGVCVAVPIAVWILELIVAAVSIRAAKVVHFVALGGFGALWVVVALQRGDGAGPWVVGALAVAVGAGFGVACARWEMPRTWLRFASLAVPVFLVLFVFGSGVSPLIRQESVEVVAAGGTSSAVPVVLVVFDEWPTSSILGADGRIKSDLYPNLAGLADSSTWYRNATSVTNSTWHAVPSIFTGRYPESGTEPESYSHPENLFTLLGGSYRMQVSEAVTRVCPPDLCAVARPGRVAGVTDLVGRAGDVYRSMLSGEQGNVTEAFQEDVAVRTADAAAAGEQQAKDQPFDMETGMATGGSPERFDAFLDGFAPDEAPTLHVLHMLMPHVPYRYLPSGLRYPEGDGNLGRDGDAWVEDPAPVQLANERMLLQAAYTDVLIGRLLDRLERTGLLERSMLVVTADHGIAFDPGASIRGLEVEVLPDAQRPETLWRPLFVKLPGQSVGRIDDSNVMSIDLVPTIADAIDVSIPWQVDGVVAGTRTSPTKVFAKSTVNPFGVDVGPQQRFDPVADFRAVLDRNLDVIAPPVGATDLLQLFRLGPYGDVVGRLVEDLPIGESVSTTVRIDDADAYGKVDRTTGVVPALLTGSSSTDGTVVVAINDVVVGVGATFADGDEPRRFAVMIPDALLPDGKNELTVFVLAADGETLRPARRQ